MNNILIGSFIFLLGVFVSSISQIILKKSSQKQYASPIKEYLNAPVIIAYCIFFSATLCSVFAFRYIPLSMGPILESSGYIFVALLSYFILKEKLNRKKILGLATIIIGILVYSL